jgi:hypothetical protein
LLIDESGKRLAAFPYYEPRWKIFSPLVNVTVWQEIAMAADEVLRGEPTLTPSKFYAQILQEIPNLEARVVDAVRDLAKYKGAELGEMILYHYLATDEQRVWQVERHGRSKRYVYVRQVSRESMN